MEQKNTEFGKLDTLIKCHEDLIPNVQKTAIMVDLYWKCYAYGDELKPHVEFLDGVMLSSTRDIAPSCLENVDELIERQEKSLSQLDSKRNIVTDLIAKGKVILQNPDKPKFLEANVKRIQEGWEDTKNKATDRLQLLNETKNAFIGYAENSETIATDFETAEEEIKKVKKIFNLDAANADMKKRQDILKKTDDGINGLFNSINNNYNTMCITIPEDKTFLRRLMMVSMVCSTPLTTTTTPCASPSPRTRRRDLPRRSRLWRRSSRSLEDSRAPLAKLRSLLLLSPLLTTPSRLLTPGRMPPLLSSRTSRRPPAPCSLRTELPGPWTSRRTLPPSSRSLLRMPRMSLSSFPRVTRSLLMPRLSRTSSRGSLTTSRSCRVTPRSSATSTPMMSSTGPSTELASRSSTPGWLVLKRLPLRDSPSPPTCLRSRLLMTRSRPLRRTA